MMNEQNMRHRAAQKVTWNWRIRQRLPRITKLARNLELIEMVAYPNAIEVLMNGNPDFRAIGIALAKTDPELFNRLHQETSFKPVAPWIKIAVDHLRAESLVSAIKECRAATGLGLRDAKVVIDHVAYNLGLREAPSMVLDNEALRALFDEIMHVARTLPLFPLPRAHQY
jgi:hypothetical protein